MHRNSESLPPADSLIQQLLEHEADETWHEDRMETDGIEADRTWIGVGKFLRTGLSPVRSALERTVNNYAANMPMGKRKFGHEKFQVETDIHPERVQVYTNKTNHLTKISTKTAITLGRQAYGKSIEIVDFQRRGKDSAGMNDPLLEKNFSGPMEDLSLRQLGRLAFDLSRASVFVDSRNRFVAD